MATAEAPPRLAFLFPGVGVRGSGREGDFFARHERRMAPPLEEVGALVGADLREGLDPDGLAGLDEERRQAFTYAFGAGMVDVLGAHGMVPEAVAGYSFGVYAALHAAEALTLADGLAILRRAHEVMSEASAGGEWSMAVTIGLDAEGLGRLRAKGGLESVRLASENNPICKVLAGERGELVELVRTAPEAGATSAQLLDVAIPYHHPGVLRSASEGLRAFLGRVDVRRAACPVVSSLTGRLLREPEELVGFLADNLSTPMSWERVSGELSELGLGLAVECGPGVSLTQNARFMSRRMKVVNVRNVRRLLEA